MDGGLGRTFGERKVWDICDELEGSLSAIAPFEDVAGGHFISHFACYPHCTGSYDGYSNRKSFMDGNQENGLSNANRNYVVALAFFALLVFGPVEPYGLLIRMLYLVAVPVFIWFLLWLFGRYFSIDPVTNDYINRALTASIAGMLLAAAYVSFTSEYHLECTQYARDGDGSKECVGELITVPGPDKGNAFMLILLAGVAFWIAVASRRA